MGERSVSPVDSISSEEGEEIVVAVGQLSVNKDKQVRYHGKASGLYLLGIKDHVDGRNEEGIWCVFLSRIFMVTFG
jgi:hypothetical protein